MPFQQVVRDLGPAELIPIPGAHRDLLSTRGGIVETAEITCTTGWSNTQTREASISVTAEISGSFGAADFSLSSTVGFGYSDSTTLSKLTTVKQTYSFRPAYITTYYQWGARVGDKLVLNGKDHDQTQDQMSCIIYL